LFELIKFIKILKATVINPKKHKKKIEKTFFHNHSEFYTQICSSLDCLDLKTGKWTEMAPISIPRWQMAVVALEQQPEDCCIYAIGGSDSQTCYSTVERYDIGRNEWTRAAEMGEKRAGAGIGIYSTPLFLTNPSELGAGVYQAP
jgi:hypothetical protein